MRNVGRIVVATVVFVTFIGFTQHARAAYPIGE
jgi:hypothetical protein